MTDRRRNARFSVQSGWEGQLRTLDDVVVESHAAGNVWVISRTPVLPGERLMLHLTDSSSPVLLGVRVADSRPINVEGMIRNRVHLAVVDRESGVKRNTDGSTTNTVIRAVLIRDVPVCLLNVSLSGCLLESRTRLQAPVAGQLRVIVDGEGRVDDIRLSRCIFVEGSGDVYRAGAEFLWTDLPGERSVRRAVRLFQDGRRGGGRHEHQHVKSDVLESSRLAIDTAWPEGK